MNVSGVTNVAQIIPQNNTLPQPREVEQIRVDGDFSEVSTDVINTSMAASIQVMDMAQQSFEDAALRLVEEMAAFTGVGQNVDVYA